MWFIDHSVRAYFFRGLGSSCMVFSQLNVMTMPEHVLVKLFWWKKLIHSVEFMLNYIIFWTTFRERQTSISPGHLRIWLVTPLLKWNCIMCNRWSNSGHRWGKCSTSSSVKNSLYAALRRKAGVYLCRGGGERVVRTSTVCGRSGWAAKRRLHHHPLASLPQHLLSARICRPS